MQSKKKINIAIIALLIAAISVSGFFPAFAVTQEEKDAAEKAAKQASEEADTRKKEAEETAKKKAAAVANFEDAEKELEKIQTDMDSTNAEIQSTQTEIDSTKADIDYTQGEITATQQKIGKTQQKIRDKEEEIEEQNKALGNRLVAMYKSGHAGLVDVLLNSESVEGMLANWGMVHRILDSDQELLEKLQKDYEELEEIKEELRETEEELERINVQLMEKQSVLEKQELSLKEEQLKLAGQKAETKEIKKKFKAEADRLHDLQEQKEAEAAEMAAEAARMQAEAEAMIVEVEEEEEEEADGTGPVNKGPYIWPTASNWEQSDNYGWRICPFHGREFHNGLDIVLTSGTNGAPVYAIANGVVTKSSWYGGYGNCIMYAIKGGYTVLYGHLSGFNCSEGQKVKKGDVLGYIGSTGNSTGPHLHFTVFKGGDTVNPYSLY